MPEAIELDVGRERWTLTIPADRRVALRRDTVLPPRQSPAELVREALEHPHQFEAMRRALTPDDHVTIVLDSQLPHAAAMLAEVLAHLQSGGVLLEAVTVLSEPGAPEGWIDELPDEFADIKTEIHDPSHRDKLAYLATTG